MDCGFVSSLVSAGVVAGVSFENVFRKLSVNLLNSSSSKISVTPEISGSHISKSFSSNSTGTSNNILANSLESNPNSLDASTFSFIFPLSLSVLAKRFSMEPNSAINFFAVFSPTPGSPGMLSALSPIIPRKSITCSGVSTSNFFCTSGIPQTSYPPPNELGLYIKIFSETNCAKSLSGVTINVW